MRRIILPIVAATVLLVGVARGSWGPSGCSAVAPLLKAQTFRWEKQEGGWYHLYHGQNIKGAYHPEEGFRTWLGFGKWGEPTTSPVNEPVPFVGKKKDWMTHGVDETQLNKGDPAYKLNGQPISKEDAYKAVQKGTLSDDSKKCRLVVIGPGREQVIKDCASGELSGLLRDCIVHDYAPDHWHVARAGFVTSGKPTIYFQAADGTVLHRQDDYEGGAAALAEAIRKADPNYKPTADPDLRKTSPLPDLSGVPSWGWLLAALGGLFAYLQLRNPNKVKP